MRRIVLTLVVLVFAIGCGDDSALDQTTTSAVVVTTTTTAPEITTTVPPLPTTPSSVVDISDAGRVIHVESDGDAVFATGVVGADPYLFRLDAVSGTTNASWPLETVVEPGTLSLAVGGDFAWVVLRSTVTRVDPVTGAQDAVDLGKGPVDGTWLEYPWAVAADAGAAWVVVVDQEGSEAVNHLYRLDAAFATPTEAVRATMELGPGLVADMLAWNGTVWVLMHQPDGACGLLAVDGSLSAAPQEVALSQPCDARLATMATGVGYVYVADRSGRIRWIDPSLGAEVAWHETDGNGMVAFSEAGGVLWGGIEGYDFGNGAVIGTRYGYHEVVATSTYDRFTVDLAATAGTVWAVTEEPSALLRVVPDPVRWGPDPVGEPCSATGVNYGIGPSAGVAGAVQEMRDAVRDAAWSCDYDTLADLGLPGAFEWSTNPNAPDNPVEYWRAGEPNVSYLAGIVQLFSLPYGVRMDGTTAVYVWPSAAAYQSWAVVPAAERAELAGVFTPEDLEGFADEDFYLGQSIAIDEHGDWLWYLAPGG